MTRFAIGTLMDTVVPTPFVLLRLIVPPINSMLRFAMVKPRPVPVALVEK